MKKSLLAFAAVSALSCTTIVSAQTNITIYGVVDLGLVNENRGAGTPSVLRLTSGNQLGSRLGFRGTEDLGGGLTASFQLENGFNADDGSAAQGGLLFGRAAWVGLTGSLGTVRLGRQISLLFANSDVFDPFGDTLAGDSGRLINYSGNRTNNAITYTNAYQSFRTQVLYGLGEVAGSSSAGRTLGAMVGYRSGPVDVMLTSTTINNADGSDSNRTTLLGGNYNFGVLRAYAAYTWNKGFGTLDTRDALVGVGVPLGAGNLMASYIKKTDKFKSNGDVNQVALGYYYDISKRTAFYTSISRTDNDSAASYNAAAAGAKSSLVNAGIRHRF